MKATNKSSKVYTIRCVALVTLSAGLCGLSAQAGALDLADQPLSSAANVQPNILVAVDDSGSMDLETLFPTDEGWFYWDGGRDAAADANGKFFNSGKKYGYLFPFDQIHPTRRTIPPIPELAYARAADYNRAYFNPSVTYTPWLNYPQSQKANAPYDPEDDNGTLDLTQSQTGNFEFQEGMVFPGDGGDETVADSDSKSISYFPATFYLKPAGGDAALPDNYGYNPDKTIKGKGPDGQEELVGYEIQADNFSTTGAYEDAIQNFANWFTYYRKRHLATRGGIVAAFDRISDMRVGSCTINDASEGNPSRLQMRNLIDESQRASFYSGIFGIDYSTNRTTPNRQALDYLGEQLEKSNPDDPDSIITASCQRNFAILFTDGYSDIDRSSDVGNVDKTFSEPFADSYSDTIADIAMEYYKHLDTPWESDILRVPAACNESNPDPRLDCETDLHMSTFGVTLNQVGTIFNNFSTEALRQQNADPYANPPDWPNPNRGARSRGQIDDLWHAAVNSRGALLNAKTPEQITDAFSDVLDQIVTLSSAASGVTANAGSLTTDSVVYRASFGGDWHGDLKALALGRDLNDTSKLWSASEQLNGVTPDSRTIFTLSTNRNGNGNDDRGAAFRYDKLRNVQKADLTEAQLHYIRGDRSQEKSRDSGTFRNRAGSILGDIVHSTPAYVGAPDRFRFPDDWIDRRHPDADMPEDAVSPYSDPSGNTAFVQQNADRAPMLYVGANDGMLHGFDAETGNERVAYVPDAVIPHLADLTEPNYRHRYYVDESPVVGDVVMDTDNGLAWRTVLVSGLGNGGTSVFALDVTDPDAFSEDAPEDTVLWEYTDNQIGRTFGKPSIVRLHNSNWVAMVSSGYADGSSLISTGTGPITAALYLIDIESGDLIERIETPGRGLSEPFPVDLDGDFVTDYAYAGDLDGNLWKFDLTSDTPAAWSATKLFTATYDDNPQPITTQPQVGVHPYGKNYGVMVYFGTGKYLEPKDAALDTDVRNSIYGIWDPDVFTFNEANNGEPLFSPDITSDIPRRRLTQQSVIPETAKNGDIYRVLSSNAVDYQESADDTEGKRGWVLDLPADTGELVIDNLRIQGETVAFSTTMPSAQVCKPGGGGYFMIVDSETGGRTGFPIFDLNGDNQFVRGEDTVDFNDDNVSVSGIRINQGAPGGGIFLINRKQQGDRVTLPTSDGNMTQIDVNVGQPPDRRRSWREIRQ